MAGAYDFGRKAPEFHLNRILRCYSVANLRRIALLSLGVGENLQNFGLGSARQLVAKSFGRSLEVDACLS